MISNIELGNKKIGTNKTYVIAEVSGSHAGDLIKMKKLIKSAFDSGADAIKIQKFSTDNLVTENYEYYEDLKNLEFDDSIWPEIISYAKKLT